LWSPPLAVGIGAVTAIGLWFAARRHRRSAEREVVAEVAVLGELVTLGLAAGMTFVAALDRAGRELRSSLADEVDVVVRTARRDGNHGVLAVATGHGRRLYLLAARAMATGAPMLDAVEMFVAEERDAERARRQAAVRRLPVTLVFPLALLILPGFVVVVLAPALVGSLQRLGS
jgi:Flp pilus assembly protein TadB